MYRRSFLIFLAVVSLLVGSVIWFIQSRTFAAYAKNLIARYAPRDLGLEIEFADLSVKLFPPGISINQPSLKVADKNVLNLPGDSTIEAHHVDLIFLPFQMLSGRIQVNEVRISEGRIDFDWSKVPSVDQPKVKASGKEKFIEWKELLQIRTDRIRLDNTLVSLKFGRGSEAMRLRFLAEELVLAKTGDGEGGYETDFSIDQLEVGTADTDQFWKRMGFASIPLFRLSLHALADAKGLELKRLQAKWSGLDLEANGKIQGDVLQVQQAGTKLLADLRFKLQGDLLQLPWLKAKVSQSVSGRAALEGGLKGDLLNPLTTLRAESQLSFGQVSFGAWGADELGMGVNWVAAADGGEISVSKLKIQSTEEIPSGLAATPRAWGGVVTSEGFKFRPRFEAGSEPVSIRIPLRLQRAHLHWLGAGILKSVYPLDFRVTGDVESVVTLPKGAFDSAAWMQTRVDLTIPRFDLNNQKLGVKKPYSSIVNAENLRLTGPVRIDTEGVKFERLQLKLPRSQFTATGGVNFERGLDIPIVGSIQMEDVGALVSSPIRGEGPLNVRVHGPGDRIMVDFNTQLKGAQFLGINFGDFQGQVSLDEGPSLLYFRNCRVTQGSSQYTGNGVLGVSDPDSIEMNIQIPTGNLADFTKVFENLTKELSWFPRTIQGRFAGEVLIKGGLSLDRLSVEARVAGTDWEYVGEKFKSGRFIGGYDRGKYFLRDFQATKRQGQLLARISLDSKSYLDWRLETEGLGLSDFDHLATLAVPIRGKVDVMSEGKGTLDSIEALTQIQLSDLSVRGAPLPPSNLIVKSRDGVLELKGSALGGQGTLDAAYDLKPKGRSYVRTEFNELDFTPILMLLNSKNMEDSELQGLVSGGVQLDFRSTEAELASGRFRLSKFLVRKSSVALELSQGADVEVRGGNFRLDKLSFGSSKGQLEVSLQGEQGELEGSIKGLVDLRALEFLTSSVTQATGAAAVDVEVGGLLKVPELYGQVIVGGQKDPVSLGIEGLASPIENISGNLAIRKSVVQAQRLRGDLSGGQVTMDGSAEFFSTRFPELKFVINLRDSRIRMFPFHTSKMSGELKVTGHEFPYTVGGEIFVESALIKEKLMSGGQGKSLRSARYVPLPSIRTDTSYPKFKLDIRVRAEKNILVQNDLFDAELRADVRVVNTLDAPRILGRVNLLQGTLSFKDRVFRIDSAEVEFDNPTLFDPRFNLTAHTEITNNRIQLYAHGKTDAYRFEFSSVPAMPENEILSLLALGFTSDEMSRLRTDDRQRLEQGEAASLVLHSTDFNRNLEEKTGFQVQIDEAVDNQTGTSIFRPKGEGDVSSGPKIVIKRQIGKKVDLSVGSTVGVGSNNQKEVNAEFRVTPGFSIIGVWDTTDGASAQSRDSYGIDLKVQKRFK